MWKRLASMIPLVLLMGVSCNPQLDTLPPPVPPDAPVRYYDLEIPADLEVRSVDFSATTYTDVTGTHDSGPVSTVAGRAFVQVRAVHRTTGELYLLVYEDFARRRRPVHVIRLVPGTVPTRPAPTG